MTKVPLDKTFLRQLFLKHKTFLKKVFLSKLSETKTLIEHASNLQVNVLIRIIYLIIHEAIPIEKKLVASISPAKKKFLVAFNKNHLKVSNYLLKYPINQKKFLLLKFSQWLPKFLTPLFHHG